LTPGLSRSETALVETFIFDYEGDLYGQDIEAQFVARVRDERTFPDVEALKAQIARDVAQTRALLAAATPGRQLIVLETLQRAVQYEDADAWRAGLLDLEARWFAPLQRALASGRIDHLRLEAPTAYATLAWESQRGDQWKLWRRPEPLATIAQALAKADQ